MSTEPAVQPPSPLVPPAAAAQRAWRIALAFVLLHLLAYRLSFVHPLQGLNITPWNPPAALSVILLVWRPRWWWLAWLTFLGSDLVVRGLLAPTPADLLAAGAVVASHAAIAQLLLRRFGRPPDIRTRAELLVLFAIATAGALLSAVAYVGAQVLLGSASVIVAPLDALGRYWIGDAVGQLVTLPLLFIAFHPQRREVAAAMLRSAAWWLLAALALAVCTLVFQRWIDSPFKYFYLFFLPIVWAAARFGLCGASAAATLVQLLLVGALQWIGVEDATVFEFQLLMAALAGTGLLLGVTVDEQRASARSLSASLRFAAAGDSAAAIAHELGQPLAALQAYARAAQLLLRRAASLSEPDRNALAAAVDKTLAEAQRAGTTVQRLRGFIEDRAMALRDTDLGAVAQQVVAARRPRAAVMGVALMLERDSTLATLWLDPVQIEVVLRNLIDNALEAAAGAAAPRWVRVELEQSVSAVELRVLDSGPGIPAHRLPDLFVHQRSEKPAGMGLGLSLSRAIVEAHEGTLRATAGPGGAFLLSLPVGAADA